jgi:hypothetical protein
VVDRDATSHTGDDRSLIDLDSSPLAALSPDQIRQELPVPAAEVQDPRTGGHQFFDQSIV